MAIYVSALVVERTTPRPPLAYDPNKPVSNSNAVTYLKAVLNGVNYNVFYSDNNNVITRLANAEN